MNTLAEHLRQLPHSRIVAFGSSNTERADHSEARYNWVDWLDYGLRIQFGRRHHTINAGVCGNTCAQLLERFDRDVALYQPHVVFVTIGGNDSSPASGLTPAQFARQLTDVVLRVRALPGCRCVLQTYYSVQQEKLDADHCRRFHEFMAAVREVAAQQSTDLIDNLRRWEPVRLNNPQTYQGLMHDPFHVSPLGNMLWGLDVCRECGVDVATVMAPWCAEGLQLQALVDRRDPVSS